jgi:hypothetical protein
MSVIQMTGPTIGLSYQPVGTVGIYYQSPVKFIEGQSVRYVNGDISVSGKISKITYDKGDDPLTILYIPYSGPSIPSSMRGGMLYVDDVVSVNAVPAASSSVITSDNNFGLGTIPTSPIITSNIESSEVSSPQVIPSDDNFWMGPIPDSAVITSGAESSEASSVSSANVKKSLSVSTSKSYLPLLLAIILGGIVLMKFSK